MWHLFDLNHNLQLWNFKRISCHQIRDGRLTSNKNLTVFLNWGSSSEFQSTVCDVNDYFINSAGDGM